VTALRKRPMPRAALLALIVIGCQFGATGSGSPGSSGNVGPGASTPVVLDATLLGVLPESVAGFPITEAPDEAAIALADPALPKIATALDAGVAVDKASGNLGYALVVKLKPGAFNDDYFRQWRDSFDEGACNAAGGIAGTAEATIDDRTVYITTCVQGLRTYHAWLPDQDLLISASSVGEARFGEQLMDNLRVPS
jgi:hypothetical protein